MPVEKALIARRMLGQMPAGYSVIDRDGHREEILQMVIDGVPYAQIAARYGYSKDTVGKYVKERLLRDIAIGHSKKRQKLTADFMKTMEHLQKKMELFMDACDDWMRKPHSTKYTLEPRADELNVVYTERYIDGKGMVCSRREEATLQELLDRTMKTVPADMEDEGMTMPAREVIDVRYLRMDPRSMTLSALAEARKQTELIAKVTGDLKEIASTADIYGVVVPAIVAAITESTADMPEVRRKIVEALEGNLAIIEDGGFAADVGRYRKH